MDTADHSSKKTSLLSSLLSKIRLIPLTLSFLIILLLILTSACNSLSSHNEVRIERTPSGGGRGHLIREFAEGGREMAENISKWLFRRGSKAKKATYSDIEETIINSEWKRWGESIIGRALNEIEAKALSNAHYIAYLNPNPRLIEKEKTWILRTAGFKKEEIQHLLTVQDSPLQSMEYLKRPTYQTFCFNPDSCPFTLAHRWLEESFKKGELIKGDFFEGPDVYIVDDNKPFNIYEILEFKPDDHTGYNITVLDENMIEETIFASFRSAKDSRMDFVPQLAHPEVRKIFSAKRSHLDVLETRRLNISFEGRKIPEPQDFSDPKYTAGWDNIEEQIAFAKALRALDSPPHPTKTHIEWFADQAPEHIAYIRQALMRLHRQSREKSEDDILTEWLHDIGQKKDFFTDSELLNDIQTVLFWTEDETLQALHQLGRLEAAAVQATREQSVTYQWWLEFNIELSNILNKGLKKYPITNRREAIKYFPYKIFIPVMSPGKHELGIMSISRAYTENVFPLELTNRPISIEYEADGLRYTLRNTREFFAHDLVHTSFKRRAFGFTYMASPLKQAEQAHIRFMDNLPWKGSEGEERRELESHYFGIIHETSY